MKILQKSNFVLDKNTKRGLKEISPATLGHWIDFGSLNSSIKRFTGEHKVVGTAFTIKTDAFDSTMVHKAVSLAEEGDIIVIDRNGDNKYACVGEMVAYAAQSRNISGIIIDGPITDIKEIKELDIPIYATGLSPITTTLQGKSGEINSVIQCGGVNISPGDIIYGDDNGIIVIENDVNIDNLIEKAKEKEQKEPLLKKELDNGTPLASLSKADELLKAHSGD